MTGHAINRIKVNIVFDFMNISCQRQFSAKRLLQFKGDKNITWMMDRK